MTPRNALTTVGIGLLWAIFLSACSAPPAAEQVIIETETTEQDQGELSDLEALGDVDVEQRLFFVDVTLPADFAEGLSQEDLDRELEENGFRSATLNDDGSVTYTMTKGQHEQLLAELRESIHDSVNEFIADEPETYTGIEFDRDLRNFTVFVNAQNFAGEAPWLEFSLAFQAGFYFIFAGTSEDDPTLNISYVDNATGKALTTSQWPQD